MPAINKINFWALCFVAFTISGYVFLNGMSYAIIIYVITWLIKGDIVNKFKGFFTNKIALFFAGFYILHIIGLIYTSNMEGGLFLLQVKQSLLLFPILFATKGQMNSKQLSAIMLAFIAGCVVNSLCCLGYAIWRYNVLGEFYFTYSKFSIFLHPSYFSMYINMSFVFIFYLLTKEGKPSKSMTVGLYAIFFFFIFMLVLLQSKMNIIIAVPLLTVLLIKYARIEGYGNAGIATLGIVAMCAIPYAFIINSKQSRFITTVQGIKNDGGVKADAIESTQARSLVWKSALQVIAKSPVIGVGTGDADSALVTQYRANGFTGVAREKLNAHGEYFQTAVILGGIGLLYLLLLLAYPLLLCIRKKRFVYGAFIMILMLNFLVESMLERQSGSVFYGFFNSLFMFNFVI